MNKGKIVGDTYIKRVSFSKAVLWRDREISLNKEIAEKLLLKKIKHIKFIDEGKGETWIATMKKIKEVWELKTVGQEPQYYIPIEIFTRKTKEMTEKEEHLKYLG